MAWASLHSRYESHVFLFFLPNRAIMLTIHSLPPNHFPPSPRPPVPPVLPPGLGDEGIVTQNEYLGVGLGTEPLASRHALLCRAWPYLAIPHHKLYRKVHSQLIYCLLISTFSHDATGSLGFSRTRPFATSRIDIQICQNAIYRTSHERECH